MGMMPGGDMGGQMNAWMAYAQAMNEIDLNALLAEVDLNVLLEGKDLNGLLTGFAITDLLTEEQIKEYFGDADPAMLEMASGREGMFGGNVFGGMGNPRALASSADVATTDFILTRETTGFTNIIAAE